MKKIFFLMNSLKFSFYVCLFVTSILSGQNRKITLEDIWKYGTFRDRIHGCFAFYGQR